MCVFVRRKLKKKEIVIMKFLYLTYLNRLTYRKALIEQIEIITVKQNRRKVRPLLLTGSACLESDVSDFFLEIKLISSGLLINN